MQLKSGYGLSELANHIWLPIHANEVLLLQILHAANPTSSEAIGIPPEGLHVVTCGGHYLE